VSKYDIPYNLTKNSRGNSVANRTLRKHFWTFNRFLFKHKLKNSFNYQYDSNCDDYPETAFMSVSNHASFFDPWLISYPSEQPVSIMMNEDGFKAKAITRWYLEKVGTFPKKKGATDIRAMKTALKRLKDNSPLLIFPEGQTSWDGETQPIFPGIEKLVKRTKLPLLMINLSGNFISRPWWSSVNRKGTIIVSRKVVSAETLDSMTPEEVSKMITDYIYNNDCKSEKLQAVEFKCATPAEGAHRLLWKCPSCNAEDTLVESAKAMTCSSCNKEITITPNLRVENSGSKSVNDIYDWVQFQKKTILENIETCKDSVELTQDDSVRLVDVDYSGQVITLDSGSLSLTINELTFAGENETLVFPIDLISIPVFQQKDILNFDDENGSGIRLSIDKGTLYKWLAYIRYLKGYDEAEKRRYY